MFALKIAKNGGPRAVLRTAPSPKRPGSPVRRDHARRRVGTMASAHAFLTLRQLAWGTELFGPLLLTEEIVSQPLVYRDFQLHVPPAPAG
jgi:muconate cycloisomerase